MLGHLGEVRAPVSDVLVGALGLSSLQALLKIGQGCLIRRERLQGGLLGHRKAVGLRCRGARGLPEQSQLLRDSGETRIRLVQSGEGALGDFRRLALRVQRRGKLKSRAFQRVLDRLQGGGSLIHRRLQLDERRSFTGAAVGNVGSDNVTVARGSGQPGHGRPRRRLEVIDDDDARQSRGQGGEELGGAGDHVGDPSRSRRWRARGAGVGDA